MTKMIKVWEHEWGYINNPQVVPEFDRDSEERFKYIPKSDIEVKDLGKRWAPGDPLQQNPFPMGHKLGRIMILYGGFDPVQIEVVDTKTGQAVNIKLGGES